MEQNYGKRIVEDIFSTISNYVVVKKNIVEYLITALINRGHVLIEDVPGVGKTTLIKTLADLTSLSVSRIQGISDMVPSDIVGVNIFHPGKNDFIFKKGPIFTNILIFDEMNRCPPQVQSILLQAMEENFITFEGENYKLPEPFILIGTINPYEAYGTYPLPESQIDRFMFVISMGFPEENEIDIIRGKIEYKKGIESIISKNELFKIKDCLTDVKFDKDLENYILNIGKKSRELFGKEGLSPRNLKFIYQASKTLAFLRGRDFVIPDDIKEILIPSVKNKLKLLNREEFYDKIVKEVEVPV